MSGRIDFNRVNQAALGNIETIVHRWLPDGKRTGGEWTARNPTRSDKRAGSFKINLRTGAWGDFATNDRGGDLVSLASYLFTSGDQRQAAINVAEMIGCDPYE